MRSFIESLMTQNAAFFIRRCAKLRTLNFFGVLLTQRQLSLHIQKIDWQFLVKQNDTIMWFCSALHVFKKCGLSHESCKLNVFTSAFFLKQTL